MNKKIVGIITVVCVVAVAIFLGTGKKDNNVDTSIEQVVEDTNPDINDVISDSTQMDVVIEEVTESAEGGNFIGNC